MRTIVERELAWGWFCDCSSNIIIIMSTLSLLVDCHRIIGWLQDRKKLRKDWFNYLKAAEQKTKVLLKDRDWSNSHSQIHNYLHEHQQYFNYNDVAAVVELMIANGMGDKNLLFGYSNPKTKEWAALQKYMEKNSMHLLSVAKFIEQSLKFDLPAIDKSVQGLDGQLTTLKRKIDFNRNTIFTQSNMLRKEKIALGILESDQQLPIEELIQVIVRRGPKHLQKLQQLCRSEKSYNSAMETNKMTNPLERLSQFSQLGDYCVLAPESSQKYLEFEFWKPTNEWEIAIEGQPIRQESLINSTTVLENPQYRQNLLQDLSQLLYFYKGVKHELAHNSKGLGFEAQNFKSMSMVEGEVEQGITILGQIIQLLTSKQLTAPLDLKNSKKTYQLMVSHFKGFEANIATMNHQIAAYQSQIEQIKQKREQEAQKLLWLRRKVLSARPKLEEWLGELVKKEVKITGQINKFE